MQRTAPDHYATLGLDHRCTTEQIRAAYRLLAKRHHPDLNPGCAEAAARTRAINAAHEILSDPDARRAYDEELAGAKKAPRTSSGQKAERHLAQEMFLRLEEFLRGHTMVIQVSLQGDNMVGPLQMSLAGFGEQYRKAVQAQRVR